jgi:hypothetical protein
MSLPKMAASLAKESAGWVGQGLPLTSGEVLASRLDACHACEFWEARGFGGSGRCRKCGCSTQAKLRMATAKCPVGKW